MLLKMGEEINRRLFSLFFSFQTIGLQVLWHEYLVTVSSFPLFSFPLPFGMIDHREDRNLEDEGRKQASVGFKLPT